MKLELLVGVCGNSFDSAVLEVSAVVGDYFQIISSLSSDGTN